MTKSNDIIDKFFAEHPVQQRVIPSKKSQEKSNNRSIPLSKPNNRRDRLTSFSAEPPSVLKFDRSHKRIDLIPRNTAQENYVDHLLNDQRRIIFAVGPAGTGKTLLAVLRAIKALREGEIEKILITRPAVSVDEKHGFLPGDINAKMEPWTRPIFDIFEEYYGLPETKRMLEVGKIEICPLAYMRGRTFKNAYIIADEMQNATPEQTKMLLTRIGENSRMLVTGDLKQHDRGYEKNGLKDFIERIENKSFNSITICHFTKNHVERDPVVSQVLDIYGEE